MPIAEDRLSKLQALKLLQAVNQQDVDLIIKLVEQGIPNLVNYAEPGDGQCGLHLAACANSELIIKTLIRLGADCNVADRIGRTSFIRAAEYGHVQALNLLIESCERPDLSARDNEGKNILYYCLCPTKRHQECLETAIQFGANVNCVATHGKSLLIQVCENGLEKALKTLLEAGIHVNQIDEKTGESPLHYAAENGFEECTRLLLKYSANCNVVDKNKLHPAHKAAKNGHLGILRILSAYGASFGSVSLTQNSPMHLAAIHGFGAVCKFLGQRGCPATLKNYDGVTARAIAKQYNHKEALKECKKAEKYKGTKPGTQVKLVKFYDWIIENKADLELDVREYGGDDKGNVCGKINKEDFLVILAAHNAPLEEDELLPILKLHDTQKNGKIDYDLFYTGKKYVNKLYLIDGGKKQKKGKGGKGKKKKGKTKIEMPICTNPNISRSTQGGPLMNFIEHQEQMTDKARFNRDHQPENPIQDDSFWYCYRPETTFVHVNEVIKYNDKESLKKAIRNGFDVNQIDKYYKTPLMLACMDGNIQFVNYLLNHGANINALDNFKWSSLHFACHGGQKDVVELLLENGAQIDAQSFNGGTPLMRAIETSKLPVVQFLIDKGAKVHLENKKNQTALDIAKAYGDARIIHLIQAKFDQMKPLEKKRKASPKKKLAAKQSSRISLPASTNASAHITVKTEYVEPPKKSSILRTASAMRDGHPIEQPIAYQPKIAWMPEPTTDELLSKRKSRRERFGYEIDFEDYKPPFQKHVTEMVQVLDVSDD